MAIDVITLEVIRNRLQTIANEMENVLLRSSYSIIVKEAGDCTTGIFTSAGDAIAHAVAGPFHFGTMGPAIRAILDAFPPSTYQDGDAYLLNDPYSGGTHLPDIIVAAPVIHEGACVAFTTVLSHHSEMGGMVPGSMPATATEVFQEGLIIPPARLCTAGQMNDTLVSLIERNVRLPREVLGDLFAQVGAAMAGKERLQELFEEYGGATTFEHIEELLRRTEAVTRAEIGRIPDGSYSFTDYLDHDGVVIDERLLPVTATVTITGDEMVVDMTGTHPQTRGSANGPPSTVLAAIAYGLRTISDPETPVNAGTERPLRLVLPEGSMVNPIWPAAVALRGPLGARALRAFYGALVQAIPDRIAADSGTHNGALGLSGIDPPTGKAWTSALCPVSGMGARPTKDGVDCIDTHLSNLLSVEAEAWEPACPVRMTRHCLRRDSGGAGRWRGGLGLEYGFKVLRGDVVATWRGDRHFTRPWGLFGGRAGLPWRLIVHRQSGEVEEIPGRAVFTIHEGESVELLGGGCGGYGDPLERESGRVLEDVIDDKVSMNAAEQDYGVVIRQRPISVDIEKTKLLRAELRENRGPITWTFDRGPELGVE